MYQTIQTSVSAIETECDKERSKQEKSIRQELIRRETQ